MTRRPGEPDESNLDPGLRELHRRARLTVADGWVPIEHVRPVLESLGLAKEVEPTTNQGETHAD